MSAIRIACGIALVSFLNTIASAQETYDVVVYGGTSGGVMAAVQAAKMGKSVVLIEPTKHLGGLTSGGLGATDIGNKGAIGGLSRQFYKRLGKHYGTDEMWTFEPKVAEALMDEFAAEAKVPVVRGERLLLKEGLGVKVSGGRIVSITMESHKVFHGRTFIDATYEGDLMAGAGVSYHVGRESNDAYKETLNGVQTRRAHSHQFKVPVDPYVTPGDPSSGLLPGLHEGGPGEEGQGDHRVQAYNFRMCMTNVAENRIPFPKPQGYDPLRYELLLRYIQGGVFDVLGNNQRMPNGKTDTNNNGGFASDNIGMNYEYPDGDYATREKIFQEHVTYQQGMMWFLVNDPRVPENVRKEMSRWGLCKDEFVETGGWPHQLYVREARRMISDYVMTEHNCRGTQVAEDSVGMAAYGMDSHNTQRYVQDGKARNEGDIQVHGFSPYPISYRSMVPKKSQCSNLLVPVCVSSTHIAFGSIRMEPVFMVLGQSAATAACHSLDEKVAVQDVDIKKLRERLLADGQILEWTGPKRVLSSETSFDPDKLDGIVVDDSQAKIVGDWTQSSNTAGYVGGGYLHDNDANKGKCSVQFVVPIKNDATYDVRMAYTALANRATNVPVSLTVDGKSKPVKVNQMKPPATPPFLSLGTLDLKAGAELVITVSNEATDGHVIVDAVQVVPVKR